ncbi:MAG: hypothetical protein ACJ76H_13660 [Bacteriovoracaceae bacterium]
MDDSKFNLWRATFAFCFVDGILSSQENTYIQEKLNSLSFTADQKKILQSDLKTPPEIEKLLPLITRPADRGILINNIRLLSRVDNLTDNEKKKIESLQTKIMSKVNMEELNVAVAMEEKKSIANKASYVEELIKRVK